MIVRESYPKLENENNRHSITTTTRSHSMYFACSISILMNNFLNMDFMIENIRTVLSGASKQINPKKNYN